MGSKKSKEEEEAAAFEDFGGVEMTSVR